MHALSSCGLNAGSESIPSNEYTENTPDDESSSGGHTVYYIREDGLATDWQLATSPDSADSSASLAFLHAHYDELEAGSSLTLSSRGGYYAIDETVGDQLAVVHIQGSGLNYTASSGETAKIVLNSSRGIEVAPGATQTIVDLSNIEFERTAGALQYIHAAGDSNITLFNTTIKGNDAAPDGDGVSTDGDCYLQLTGITTVTNIKNGESVKEQALTTHGSSLMSITGEIKLSGNNTNMASVNDSSMIIQCFGYIGASVIPGKATLDNGSTGTTFIEAAGGELTADADNDVMFNCNLPAGSLSCKNLDYININNNVINNVKGSLTINGGTFDNIPRLRLSDAKAVVDIMPGTVFHGGGSYEMIEPTAEGASARFRGIVKLNGHAGQLINYSAGKFDISETSISGAVIDCSQGAGWIRTGRGLFVINSQNTLIHNLIVIGNPGTSMGKWLFDIKQEQCRFHNIILHNVELTETDGAIFNDTGTGTPPGTAVFSHFVFSGTTRTATQNASQLATDPRFPNSIAATYEASDPSNNDYTPTDSGLLSGGYDGEYLPDIIELQDASLNKTQGEVPFGSYRGVHGRS